MMKKKPAENWGNHWLHNLKVTDFKGYRRRPCKRERPHSCFFTGSFSVKNIRPARLPGCFYAFGLKAPDGTAACEPLGKEWKLTENLTKLVQISLDYVTIILTFAGIL